MPRESGDSRGYRTGSDRHRSDRRGQSEVLGVVLLVGIVVVGSSVVLVAGVPALAERRDAVGAAHAENVLGEVDSGVAAVADGATGESRVLDLHHPGSGGTFHGDEASWLRVSLEYPENGSTATTVVNRTLGTVAYERGGTTVAYEGGGVWRSSHGGSVVVSRPDVRVDGATLTVPVVSVDGDRSLDGTVRVGPNGSSTRAFPNASAGLTNRLQNRRVVITVHSHYYEAWGRYFEERLGADVTLDHADGTATARLLSMPDQVRLDAGIVATAGTGNLELHGTGTYTDSYDSRDGSYSATSGENGTVRAVGDIAMFGDSAVYGDLRAGGTVSFSGSPEVHGTVYWTDTPAPSPSNVDGEDGIQRIAGIDSAEAIDHYVEASVATLRRDNDNPSTTAIQNEELSVGPGATERLEAGAYYADHVSLDGGTLVLDTTDGDVVLGVRDWLSLERNGPDGSTIDVQGDGTVTVVLAGENETTVTATAGGSMALDFFVGEKSVIDVPDEDASRFRVIGPEDFEGAVSGGAASRRTTVDALIYAPSDSGGSGDLLVSKAEVFGATVVGNVTVEQNGAVHFDRGMVEVDTLRLPALSQLEYLYVTVHRATIEDR